MSDEATRSVQCRGIRGATTVDHNSAGEILEATRELLASMVEVNGVAVEELASVFFTATPDLTAAFPAAAARQMGWQQVALLDAQEIPVPGSQPCCVRVLIHWNTRKPQKEIRHVYLRGAAKLRPDLAEREYEGG